MNIEQLMRFGEKLIERIEFFENVPNDVLAADGQLALKWMRLGNAVSAFRSQAAGLKGWDAINIVKYEDRIGLMNRFGFTIHRIMVNQGMLYLADIDPVTAKITEAKAEIALLSLEFDKAIPEMIEDPASAVEI